MPSDIDPSSNDAQHAKENAGWTYVKPKSRRRRTKPTKPSTHELPPQHSQPRSGPLRPLSAIDAEYRKTRSQWEGTSCCARLRELVATSAAGVGHVSNAICLGIGTFDPSDGAWEAKRRTFIQLIAFLIIVEELEKFASNKSIKCYFQEPAFTETDTLFIQSLDHQVVESPTGFDMVKDHSLLFGVHLYRPIYAAALRRSLPSIFVGTSWDVWDQVNLSQTNDLHNLKLMDLKYNKSTFPQDTSTTAFSSTCIYWRITAAPVDKTITDNLPTAPAKETGKSSSTAPLGPSAGLVEVTILQQT